jgi:DNA-binding MarR family transcriptional regulator
MVMDGIDPHAKKLMEVFSAIERSKWNDSPVKGLAANEAHVLFCIKHKTISPQEGMKVSEIGRLMKVTTPTITQTINNLYKKGLVLRIQDMHDRRSVRIKLTDKGEEIIKKVSEHICVTFNGLSQYLGPEESDKLAELLLKAHNYIVNVKKIDI